MAQTVAAERPSETAPEKVSRMSENVFRLDRKQNKKRFQGIGNHGIGWLSTLGPKSFLGQFLHLSLETLQTLSFCFSDRKVSDVTNPRSLLPRIE
jgi:hypothetical protein